MKLFEIAKPPVDWNTKSEKQQIAMVRRDPYNISRIANPSEPVQLVAVQVWDMPLNSSITPHTQNHTNCFKRPKIY